MRRFVQAVVFALSMVVALGASPAAGSMPSGASQDVNGDGLGDVLAPGVAVKARDGYVFTRSAVVVLGSPAASPVDRRALGERGFTIRARGEIYSTEWAGDVDGDGLSDVIVDAGTGPRLVFGKRDLATVDLRTGTGQRRLPGEFVEPIGDVNGDGLADLLMVTAQDRRPFRSRYAVLRGARERDLLASVAFPLSVPRRFEGDHELNAAGPAGDVNHDGLGDFVMALENYFYCGEGGDGCGGRGFVVFGSRDSDAVRVKGTYRRGFRVSRPDGHAGYDMEPLIGYEGVRSAGDVDGDGSEDLVAGGFYTPTWLMYGKSEAGTVRARAPQATRYGLEPYFGGLAAGIGDLDGDGRSEVALTFERPRTRPWRQAVAVVFGGPRRAAIDPRTAGYVIDLPARREGAAMRAAGDVNGDGLGDFTLSIAREDGRRRRTFVVFGKVDRSRQTLTALGGGGFEIR